MRTIIVLVAAVMAIVTSGAGKAAEPSAGEQVYVKCERCHSLNGAANENGPTLHGVFGRKAGTLPGWTYSEAMKSSNVVWNAQTIDAYVTKPKEFIPDGTMNFMGLKKPEDRAALITYLEQATK